MKQIQLGLSFGRPTGYIFQFNHLKGTVLAVSNFYVGGVSIAIYLSNLYIIWEPQITQLQFENTHALISIVLDYIEENVWLKNEQRLDLKVTCQSIKHLINTNKHLETQIYMCCLIHCIILNPSALVMSWCAVETSLNSPAFYGHPIIQK